jgi:hypothetical protein
MDPRRGLGPAWLPCFLDARGWLVIFLGHAELISFVEDPMVNVEALLIGS